MLYIVNNSDTYNLNAVITLSRDKLSVGFTLRITTVYSAVRITVQCVYALLVHA